MVSFHFLDLLDKELPFFCFKQLWEKFFCQPWQWLQVILQISKKTLAFLTEFGYLSLRNMPG